MALADVRTPLRLSDRRRARADAGSIMDHGAPQWVFHASVIVMVVIAAVALIGDRYVAGLRPAGAPMAEPAG